MTTSQKTYLVTGAAGFIGSKVCEFLLAAGHAVVGIDNLNDYYDVRLKYYRLGVLAQMAGIPEAGVIRYPLSVIREGGFGRITNNQEPITLKSDRFQFHTIDIEDLPALDDLFKRSDFSAVLNLAARAGVRYSMENPHVYLTTNAHGTLNLLECQRKYGVKKQVLASTSSLYAGCPMPFTEDLPVNTPLSPYAASKKAAELMAYSYHKLYGLDTTVVRYFTVFGPAGRPDMSIFRFIKWIDEGTPIELFGDGSQSRDFTYVDDVARGTIAAIDAFGYEIINIGGGRNPISLQAVISHIEQALEQSRLKKPEAGNLKPEDSTESSPLIPQVSGLKPQVSDQVSGLSPQVSPSVPIKAKIAGKPFHIADIKETWADISKADRLLGWKPEIAPEEGFRRCVEWHVANREWLRNVVL